jgi:ParB-like chromosome segregation protein Spo0J
MKQFANTKSSNLKIHPAAELFPPLIPEQFQELKEDIKKRGVIQRILVQDDVLLDGRNRLAACRELGIEPPIEQYEGDDPVGEILARNIFRRHLTDDQRVAALAKLLGPGLEAGADARMKAGTVTVKSTEGIGRADEVLAKKAKVGAYKARTALAVGRYAPGFLDEVIEGKKRLAEAKRHVDQCNAEEGKLPGKSKRPQPEKSLQQIVAAKFQRFMDRYSPVQHREVKAILRELL